MSTPKHPGWRFRGAAAPRSAKGLTLIELGFVIIILAVIVAVALALYNTVSTNKKVSDVVTDVANIRSAVAQYAGGLPLMGLVGREKTDDGTLGAEVNRAETDLKWPEIAPFLPGRLSTQASKTGLEQALENANAWDSTYSIAVTDPYRWELGITNIPTKVIPRLKEKLANAGRGVPEISGTTITVYFEVGA